MTFLFLVKFGPLHVDVSGIDHVKAHPDLLNQVDMPLTSTNGSIGSSPVKNTLKISNCKSQI